MVTIVVTTYRRRSEPALSVPRHFPVQTFGHLDHTKGNKTQAHPAGRQPTVGQDVATARTVDLEVLTGAGNRGPSGIIHKL